MHKFKVGDVIQTKFVRRVMTIRVENVALIIDVIEQCNNEEYVVVDLFSRLGRQIITCSSEISNHPIEYIELNYDTI